MKYLYHRYPLYPPFRYIALHSAPLVRHLRTVIRNWRIFWDWAWGATFLLFLTGFILLTLFTSRRFLTLSEYMPSLVKSPLRRSTYGHGYDIIRVIFYSLAK
jgi:hypothetical protein